MNICFLIGEIISKIEYKFIIQSKNKSMVEFKIKLSDGNIVKIKSYNEMADKIYRELKINDDILIQGFLEEECIQMIDFDKKEKHCKKQ